MPSQRNAIMNRRQVLKTLGASGMVASAGCLGGGEGGGNQFTLISGPEGVLLYGVGSSMSATLRQHSDYVVNVQGGPSGQAMAELVQGNNELAAASAYLVQNTVEGKGRWEDIPIDHEPMQLMTMMDQRTAAVTKTNTDIQNYEDLGGTQVGLGPAGASYNDPWKEAINTITDGGEIEFTPTEASQEASAISADRVDAQVIPIHVNRLNPSHVNPVYVENDVRLLSYTEENANTVREEVGIGVDATPNDELPDNIAEFTSDPETFLTRSRYSLLGSDQISTDAAYEMMTALWENNGHFVEGHAGAQVFSELEYWLTTIVPEIPVHPGAAEFFQEHDVWSDEYEVAEI